MHRLNTFLTPNKMKWAEFAFFLLLLTEEIKELHLYLGWLWKHG